jgi:hypothetical protein
MRRAPLWPGCRLPNRIRRIPSLPRRPPTAAARQAPAQSAVRLRATPLRSSARLCCWQRRVRAQWPASLLLPPQRLPRNSRWAGAVAVRAISCPMALALWPALLRTRPLHRRRRTPRRVLPLRLLHRRDTRPVRRRALRRLRTGRTRRRTRPRTIRATGRTASTATAMACTCRSNRRAERLLLPVLPVRMALRRRPVAAADRPVVRADLIVTISSPSPMSCSNERGLVHLTLATRSCVACSSQYHHHFVGSHAPHPSFVQSRCLRARRLCLAKRLN